jgi:hypothetical protein
VRLELRRAGVGISSGVKKTIRSRSLMLLGRLNVVLGAMPSGNGGSLKGSTMSPMRISSRSRAGRR